MADNQEGLAELAYSKLRISENPGLILAQFYSAITGIPVGRSELIGFNRLLKTFGRSMIFFAIIDISRIKSFPEFPYGLLHKVCKDRLEATLHTELTSASSDNLDRRIEQAYKEIIKVKKIDPEKYSSKFFDDEGDTDAG